MESDISNSAHSEYRDECACNAIQDILLDECQRLCSVTAFGARSEMRDLKQIFSTQLVETGKKGLRIEMQ